MDNTTNTSTGMTAATTNNSIEKETVVSTKTTDDDESIITPRPLILGISWYDNDSSNNDSNDSSNNDSKENNNTNATIALQIARENGYDYTTTMIPNSTTSNSTTIRTDMITVSSQWWKTSIVGIVQSYYDDNDTRAISSTNTNCTSSNCILNEHILQSSLVWSSYMNIPAIILPNLPIVTTSSLLNNTTSNDTIKVNQYCSILQNVLVSTSTGMNSSSSSSQQQLWIPIPLSINGLYSWNYCTMVLCRNTGTAGCTTTSPIYCLLRIPSTTILLQQFQHHLSSSANNTNTTTNNNTITIAKYCLILCHMFIGCGYPIGCIEFNCNDFLINKKGYPTLSKIHQIILTFLLRRIGRTVRVLVHAPSTSTSTSSTSTTNTTKNTTINLLYYLQYIQHIRMKRVEIINKLDTDYYSNKEYNYLDIIQQPLQPLKDHLENNTYEVFESDPIKYNQYTIAIQYYIQDYIYKLQQSNSSSTKMKQQQQSPTANPNSNDSTTTTNTNNLIILVVGAGRGPLITAVTNAYRTVMQEQQQQQSSSSSPGLQNIQLSILGVEKNPSAVLYLQSMLHISKTTTSHPWYNFNIRIIKDDLRYITATKYSNGYKANLVISELLGSFGCNELSPECLHTLLNNSTICHPNYTTCIPYSYTSYIAPISSIKIHQQIIQQSLYPNNTYTNIIGYQQVTETPYVVRPHNASQLFNEQLCWSFTNGTSSTGITEDDDDNDNIDIDDNTNDNTKNSLERSVVLTFDGSTNPTMGTKCGCGYTDIDEQFTSLYTDNDTIDNSTNNNTNNSTNTNDSTTTTTTNHHIVPSYIITGLIGTFTTLLYKSNRTGQVVTLSTSLTNNYSTNMFSWFPLYFPFHDPILVSNPQQSKIIVSIQRKCTPIKVWYEWSIQVLLVNTNTGSTTTTNTNDTTTSITYVSPIHNPGGRSYYVSL